MQKRSREYNNESLQHSVKHDGGSVVVWCCISNNGVGDLVEIDGIMNSMLKSKGACFCLFLLLLLLFLFLHFDM